MAITSTAQIDKVRARKDGWKVIHQDTRNWDTDGWYLVDPSGNQFMANSVDDAWTRLPEQYHRLSCKIAVAFLYGLVCAWRESDDFTTFYYDFGTFKGSFSRHDLHSAQACFDAFKEEMQGIALKNRATQECTWIDGFTQPTVARLINGDLIPCTIHPDGLVSLERQPICQVDYIYFVPEESGIGVS